MTNSPEGWHTLTPRIFAEDAEELVSFLKTVFEAEGDYRQSRPSELRIGDSMIMVSDFEARGSYAACLYVYVADVEQTFNRAVAAGSDVIEAPLDTPYGDRRAVVKDRWGNMWQIAQYAAF
ncbi:MAG: glyoxalase [Pseudohongiella sp.]|nr:MAG: glyoxalase [Pseudohongiella sp.]